MTGILRWREQEKNSVGKIQENSRALIKKTLHPVGKTEIKQNAKPLVDPAFSKVEMPALYCFSMNLNETLPNANKSKKMLAHKRKIEMKERKRLIFTKKLHKMYQLAMAHQATFARILAKHSDDFGPDMDPLGSFKVNDDNEDGPSDLTVAEFDPKSEYDEGRRDSYCNLNLSMMELIQTLDATKDDMEKMTKFNGKQLTYISPLSDPTTEETVDPLNATSQRSNEENVAPLANDLEMLSIEE